MKAVRNGCPLCSAVCRVIGTSDQGKEVEIACANCTVFRVSTHAAGLLATDADEKRQLYSLLARRCPCDHVTVIGTVGSDFTYEYLAIKRLKLLKSHRR